MATLNETLASLPKGSITINNTPTSYPAGGPTVAGSSTGIGSTMATPANGGGQLTPRYYGTGGYAPTNASQAQITAARQQVINDENARQQAFNATGGIKGVSAADVGNNPIISVSGGVTARTLATDASGNIVSNSRETQLKNAGFSPTEISFLTSTRGASTTYYNGKPVPQTKASADFWGANQVTEGQKQFNRDVLGPTFALGVGTSAAAAPILGGFGAIPIAAGLFVAGSQGLAVGEAVGNPLYGRKPTSDTATQEAAIAAGYRQAEKRASQDAIGQIAYNYLPGGQALFNDNFIKGTKDYLVKSKGLSETAATREAEALYNKYAVGGAIGELGGMVLTSGGSEILGRAGVKATLGNTTIKEGTKFFSKEGQAIAAKAAAGIFPAGVAEGLAFYNIERTAKRQPFDPMTAAFYGGAGGVSAGLIGGELVAGSLTNPAVAKWVQRGLYSIDPTEKPGDILGDVVSKGTGKEFAPTVKVITSTPVNTNQSSAGKQTTKESGKIIDFVKDNSGVFTPVNANATTDTPVNPFTNTDVPVNPIVPVNANTNTNVATNSETNTETNTFTNVFTPVNTPVNIMAATGAPFPPMFGGDAGGRGTGRATRERSRFTNELAGALSAFDSFAFGFGPQPTYASGKKKRGHKR
jgi:hypothetical protein